MISLTCESKNKENEQTNWIYIFTHKEQTGGLPQGKGDEGMGEVKLFKTYKLPSRK